MKHVLFGAVMLIALQPATAALADGSQTAVKAATQVIPFSWCPPKGPKGAYKMADPADQHRILLMGDIKPGGTYPVVLGFHGQPKRGKPPRDYLFLNTVPDIVQQLVDSGEVGPLIFVLPVFRFQGQNWPGFDPRAFRRQIERLLRERKITPQSWIAFGHSGAAGCGGEGLNRIFRMDPLAVGFFDTCLGRGWQRAIKQLRRQKILTINIHTVETAGFRPRQRPEYQSWFDFGRAYEPVGMRPTPCPTVHPGKRLRDQPFKCASTEDGVIKGFVVDAGEGVQAHKAILSDAIPYFLRTVLSR